MLAWNVDPTEEDSSLFYSKLCLSDSSSISHVREMTQLDSSDGSWFDQQESSKCDSPFCISFLFGSNISTDSGEERVYETVRRIPVVGSQIQM